MPAIDCAIGPASPGLYGQHSGCFGQKVERFAGRDKRSGLQQRTQHLGDDVAAMFRGDIREIAPDLTPAGHAAAVFDLDEHGRAIPHCPEGRLHRVSNGIADTRRRKPA